MSSPDNLPPAAAVIKDETTRNRTVIGLLMFSTFSVILNETVMGVALPRLMNDLGITASAGQWLTTAFLLTMAVIIPITGFLIQSLTTRFVFLLAACLFSAGTLLCALSPGLAMLIVGRIVQASGTAIMMPLLMTTVMNLVPPESRGKTMGNISIVISVAPAIGPTLSGLILEVLSWRWLFIVMLPVGLLSLIAGALLMVNVTEPRKVRPDYLSIPMSAVGFGGLVYGLSALGEGHGKGGAIPPWLPLVIGGLVLAAFIWRQVLLARRDAALLDLRTFTVKVFTVATVMMGLAMMSLFGMIILLPIFMQTVLGLSTLQAGLLLLPGGLMMGIASPFVGRLFDRFGARKLVIPGAVGVSAGMWLMTTLSPGSPVAMVLVSHIVLSFGLAFTFTPLFTSGLGSLPKRLYSHGSAVLGTVQQVSGAAGIALFVSVMSIQIGTGMAAGADMITATAQGLHRAFLYGAVISLLMILAAFFVRRPPPQPPE